MKLQKLESTISGSKHLRGWPLAGGLLACLTLATTLTLHAAAPLSSLSFSEGGGFTTTNAGTLGGVGNFVRQTGFPVLSANVPSGPYAPSGNNSSVDFGAIGAGQGGRAVDFPGALGRLDAFTICGWLNCRDLTIGPGGNRIMFALETAGGRGFDLVQLADGSLRLGVNQWPDAGTGGPRSSAGWITADPDAGAANWVFFAVTYDGSQATANSVFYFGTPTSPAMLDFVPYDYNRGALTNTGSLTVGNFGTVAGGARTETGGNSRCFRGLIDEIKVLPEALTLEQIQAIQMAAPLPAPALAFAVEPVDQTVIASSNATFTAQVRGSLPFTYQWQRANANISAATESSYTVTGAMPADDGAQFRVIVSNSQGQLTSSNATLHITTDSTPPTVAAVQTTRDLTSLRVVFSEPVDAPTAENPANYKLFFGAQQLATISAILQPNLTDVVLTTAPMTEASSHKLNISNVRDRSVFPNTVAAVDVLFISYDVPGRTDAIVETRFEEGFGTTVTNTGMAGGLGIIDFGLTSSAAGIPAFSNNVPMGPYAPAGNLWSLSFGKGAGHAQYAGKAVDFPDSVRQSTADLEQFTVCGWINVTDGTIGGGGNRVISTWPQNANNVTANRLTGFDVVVTANGTMRLGVNMAPDYPSPPGNIGPTSSSGKVTVSANADPANWVFFAVSYDSTAPEEKAKFFFGNAQIPAALDIVSNYNRGPITNCSVPVSLALGNFNDPPQHVSSRDSTSNSRAFRGLMDEIRFFASALTLEEIQQIQIRAGVIVTTPPGFAGQPVSQGTFDGQPARFSVTVTGTPPVSLQWQRDGQNIPNATGPVYSLPAVTLADNGAVFRAVATNEQGSVTSSDATLTVWPETWRKVRFTFEEGAGLATTNLGNLQGFATFTQQNDYPVFSTKVPTGPNAPSGSGGSVDFGTILAGQGGRAIDWGNGLTPTLGAMQGFTLSGWVNVRDLAVGLGGNRIVFALESAGGRGFDLVHLADGSLRLGVNQWPDAGTGGPFSSPGKLTVDPEAGPDNWVFFAVTYDPALQTEHVKYYFGSPQFPVALDVARDYTNRGAIAATGPITLGNFSVVAGARTETVSSRVFRGLMDDIQVHNRVLSLEDIAKLQKGLSLIVEGPGLAAKREGNQIVISWVSDVSFQLVYKDQLAGGSWTAVAEPIQTVGNVHTVRINANEPARFYRLQQ